MDGPSMGLDQFRPRRGLRSAVARRVLPWHLNWTVLAATTRLTLHATKPEAPASPTLTKTDETIGCFGRFFHPSPSQHPSSPFRLIQRRAPPHGAARWCHYRLLSWLLHCRQKKEGKKRAWLFLMVQPHRRQGLPTPPSVQQKWF